MKKRFKISTNKLNLMIYYLFFTFAFFLLCVLLYDFMLLVDTLSKLDDIVNINNSKISEQQFNAIINFIAVLIEKLAIICLLIFAASNIKLKSKLNRKF